MESPYFGLVTDVRQIMNKKITLGRWEFLIKLAETDILIIFGQIKKFPKNSFSQKQYKYQFCTHNHCHNSCDHHEQKPCNMTANSALILAYTCEKELSASQKYTQLVLSSNIPNFLSQTLHTHIHDTPKTLFNPTIIANDCIVFGSCDNTFIDEYNK